MYALTTSKVLHVNKSQFTQSMILKWLQIKPNIINDLTILVE